MTHFDTIIIGGGPAGYTAGLYCARAGLTVAVLEMLGAGGQMATTTEVDNYPGFAEGIDGFTLGEQMQAGAERFGVQTVYAEVTAVDLHAQPKRIITTEGDFTATTVIVATGANPRTMGLPEEDSLRGCGVSYCATCDGNYFKGKTVAVIGGGNAAADEVLTLARLCEKVYLVHRRDQMRAEKIYLQPLSQTENVEYVWNSTVSAVLHDQKVTGLQVQNVHDHSERTLAVDGVFVAIGRQPNTALFADMLDLDAGGYVRADESTRTNIDGVFAAGDLRVKPLRQIVTAVADGAVAAKYAEEFVRSMAID